MAAAENKPSVGPPECGDSLARRIEPIRTGSRRSGNRVGFWWAVARSLRERPRNALALAHPTTRVPNRFGTVPVARRAKGTVPCFRTTLVGDRWLSDRKTGQSPDAPRPMNGYLTAGDEGPVGDGARSTVRALAVRPATGQSVATRNRLAARQLARRYGRGPVTHPALRRARRESPRAAPR